MDLAQAALLIAQEEYPDLEIRPYIAKIDQLAAGAPVVRDLPTEAAAPSLMKYLFQTQGFQGNEENYYDPRNSYLNEVLDRRLGIPITLALVAMEVGRRVGLRFSGVGLPGHFILKHPQAGGDLFFDPFRGGAEITLDDCREIVSKVSGGLLPLRGEHLRPATKLEILIRILRNLKGAYERANDLPRALAAVERILILDPEDHDEIRERGMILSKMGLTTKALVDLETYLRLEPDAVDTDEVWEQVRAIRQARSLLD